MSNKTKNYEELVFMSKFNAKVNFKNLYMIRNIWDKCF